MHRPRTSPTRFVCSIRPRSPGPDPGADDRTVDGCNGLWLAQSDRHHAIFSGPVLISVCCSFNFDPVTKVVRGTRKINRGKITQCCNRCVVNLRSHSPMPGKRAWCKTPARKPASRRMDSTTSAAGLSKPFFIGSSNSSNRDRSARW